jgi:hypothetical protein
MLDDCRSSPDSIAQFDGAITSPASSAGSHVATSPAGNRSRNTAYPSSGGVVTVTRSKRAPVLPQLQSPTAPRMWVPSARSKSTSSALAGDETVADRIDLKLERRTDIVGIGVLPTDRRDTAHAPDQPPEAALSVQRQPIPVVTIHVAELTPMPSSSSERMRTVMR